MTSSPVSFATARFGTLALLVALSACSQKSKSLSVTAIKSLAPTATMPKGTATYIGKVENRYTDSSSFAATYSGVSGTSKNLDYKLSANLKLDANFDAKTVAATVSDGTIARSISFTPTGGSARTLNAATTLSGSVSGGGTISGNTFTAAVSGTVLATGSNFDGSSFANVSTPLSDTFGATFVGTNADAFYSNVRDTSVANVVDETTIYGTKQ